MTFTADTRQALTDAAEVAAATDRSLPRYPKTRPAWQDEVNTWSRADRNRYIAWQQAAKAAEAEGYPRKLAEFAAWEEVRSFSP
jgi:hypothetical protein